MSHKIILQPAVRPTYSDMSRLLLNWSYFDILSSEVKPYLFYDTMAYFMKTGPLVAQFRRAAVCEGETLVKSDFIGWRKKCAKAAVGYKS
jgi:hypothetical protein